MCIFKENEWRKLLNGVGMDVRTTLLCRLLPFFGEGLNAEKQKETGQRKKAGAGLSL